MRKYFIAEGIIGRPVLNNKIKFLNKETIMRKLYMVVFVGTAFYASEFRWTVVDDAETDFNNIIKLGARYNNTIIAKLTAENFSRLKFKYALNENKYLHLPSNYNIPTLTYDDVMWYLNDLKREEMCCHCCPCSECSKGKE